MTRIQVINAMTANNIKGEVRGAGKNWEVELPNDTQMKKFCKLVIKVSGYKKQWGAWVLNPNYVEDTLDGTYSRIHY